MCRLKTPLFSCLIVAFCLALIISCRDASKHKDAIHETANIINNPVKAPNFSLNTLEGNTVSLESYKGKFVVIHIATTWCPFCNAEAPYLEELYQDYKGKNVEVLLIDVKEPKNLVQEKLREKYNLSFPILLDEDGLVAASYAPDDVLPDLARDEVMLASNLLIDPDGNIQFMSLLDSKNFDAELKQLKKTLHELL
ncbi:peroxiredoxin family protein [Snuella sedimenti]|uniref:TlpA family protein disulfide reductase n=1 Tax=Snuella sedimenti TaxID=2798802 RepID=A0A8J7JB33_9FLAO|nr:peroxiredoxin family protein [Snuella sedimenti]MBJ6367804.1 TlpA family protein disulfide reductase [Snuella sedimenti]